MNRIFSEIASYIAHQSGRPLTFLFAASIIKFLTTDRLSAGAENSDGLREGG